MISDGEFVYNTFNKGDDAINNELFQICYKKFVDDYNEMLEELEKVDKRESDEKPIDEIFENFKSQASVVDEGDANLMTKGSNIKMMLNNALFDRKKVYATLKDIDKKIKVFEKSAKNKDKELESKDAESKGDVQANLDKASADADRFNAERWRSFVNAMTVALDNALKQFHKYYGAIKKAIKNWNESHPDQAVDTSDIEDDWNPEVAD